jgi:glycosyltransferase involved in cell wall biosynthesis
MNQKKIKIAFLHRANDPYTLERIKFFSENNYDVYSIFTHEKNNSPLINGIKYYSLKTYRIDRIPFVRRIFHYYDLKRILKTIKPNIFHVVSALNLMYASYNLNMINVIENQGSDLIDTPKKYRILIPYYKLFYKKVDGVIQDSQLLQKCSLKYGAIRDSNFNRVIEIGIDFQTFNKNVTQNVIRKHYNLENRPIVLHTRGIKQLYNLDIVLKSAVDVCKKIPNVVYIITTDYGKLDQKLKKFIADNKLINNFLFVGFQDRKKELKYFYRDANVVISVPSSDSSPFSVYESMACLTPVIVSDLPWLYSRFIPDKHLITVPVRSSEKLAASIENVINSNNLLDLHSVYRIIYNDINLYKENTKLESFYKFLLNKIVG